MNTIEQSVISEAKNLIFEIKTNMAFLPKSSTAYHSVSMSYAGVMTLQNLVDRFGSGFSQDTQLAISDIRVEAFELMTKARNSYITERPVL